jgi:hypothetical protein
VETQRVAKTFAAAQLRTNRHRRKTVQHKLHISFPIPDTHRDVKPARTDPSAPALPDDHAGGTRSPMVCDQAMRRSSDRVVPWF